MKVNEDKGRVGCKKVNYLLTKIRWKGSIESFIKRLDASYGAIEFIYYWT